MDQKRWSLLLIWVFPHHNPSTSFPFPKTMTHSCHYNLKNEAPASQVHKGLSPSRAGTEGGVYMHALTGVHICMVYQQSYCSQFCTKPLSRAKALSPSCEAIHTQIADSTSFLSPKGPCSPLRTRFYPAGTGVVWERMSWQMLWLRRALNIKQQRGSECLLQTPQPKALLT